MALAFNSDIKLSSPAIFIVIVNFAKTLEGIKTCHPMVAH
jgi:hypothetical protein